MTLLLIVCLAIMFFVLIFILIATDSPYTQEFSQNQL